MCELEQVQKDLVIIMSANEAMYSYLEKKVYETVWAKGHKLRIPWEQYQSAYKLMNLGDMVTDDGRHVQDLHAYATENAILKGVNRILKRKSMEFPGDKTRYRIGVNELRSLINVSIAVGDIQKYTREFIMRSDTVVTYGLTSLYFMEKICSINNSIEWTN